MYKLGVDLGGTKIEAILLDDSLNVLERKRISTPKENYYEIVDAISNLVSEISSNVSDFSLGICTPGAISKKTGLIKNSNTQCLIRKPLKEDLEEKLNKNISMENDANCFVMAESKMGSAKQFDFVFGVIMGTGVGGGIVVNGKLHSGRTNIAGEWGHHTLHHNGNPCYCGKTGCVETYISGPALEKKWELLSGQTKSIPEILSNLENDVGQKWKSEFLENFGFGLANVIDILDPDAIVLGGGLSNIDFLYTEGKNSVYEKVFSDSVDTPILKNELGDSAGVYGAALLN
ncbi:N-acetyl-D-glucosamine kinase protein [Marine Group I thaumarchaeote SCGC AAA799-D11]|uniref:N-acetyl-D-glucosamine kinase protein n=1 Tax=Marine Group I thaumarchaeote SCGC AAA799-D11 TaxID=1502291 RepID=A0A087RMU7_9ARCH|nr:N-acetyl-D-glucosamine kinase protein [Marine Group I thaumarchaeote SCGC AAA799-D11]